MSKVLLSCVLLAMLALPAAALSPRVDEGGDGGSSVVPEPSAGLVFGAGALIVAARLRRQRR